ncbi:MAG: DsbA family protein [Candidatus Limnocylindrales bacterium]|jgi:protein-disulfide isomerase
MPSKNRSRRFSIDSGTPPNDRGPARQGRPTGGEVNRNLARAGTRGSESGVSSLALWSLAFVAVAVVVVVVTLIATGAKSGPASGPVAAPAVVTPLNIASGRTLGYPNAPITLDLYGDFRCSACLSFTTGGTEQSLIDNYISTNKVKLVWHDFLSIDKIQGNTASRDAANAAWCAADQGKFWVMHDWLFANQSATEDASAFTAARLSDIGKAAGLDMSAYQPCIDAGRHYADIAAEDQATPSGVTGTPAVFINGALVTGGSVDSWPQYPQIKAYIDSLG